MRVDNQSGVHVALCVQLSRCIDEEMCDDEQSGARNDVSSELVGDRVGTVGRRLCQILILRCEGSGCLLVVINLDEVLDQVIYVGLHSCK